MKKDKFNAVIMKGPFTKLYFYNTGCWGTLHKTSLILQANSSKWAPRNPQYMWNSFLFKSYNKHVNPTNRSKYFLGRVFQKPYIPIIFLIKHLTYWGWGYIAQQQNACLPCTSLGSMLSTAK